MCKIAYCNLWSILVLSFLMKGGTLHDRYVLVWYIEKSWGRCSLFCRAITFVIVSFFAPKKFCEKRKEK